MAPSSQVADSANPIAARVRHRVLPLLMAAWFIAYIDRFNVSFAALTMNRDIGLSPAAFGFGAGVFFVGYSIFEVPSNLILFRVGARRWLSRIMVSWGVVTMLMAMTRGTTSFYTLRFLLGLAEAGCFPGMAYYLSLWLTPRERAAALGLLGSMTMASGIVGGPLASALLGLRGFAGLSGWQWLFLVEGLPAIAIGLLILRYLPDSPDTVGWLTADERALMKSRLGTEAVNLPTTTSILTVMNNSRYWLWAAAFFCASVGGSSITVFRPLILKEVAGLSDRLTALLTSVPAIVGAFTIIAVGHWSTKTDERRWHAAVPMFISGAALALIGVTYGLPAALLVSSIAAVGVAAQPPLFAAVSSEATGAVNAAGIAFVNAISALGAFVGPAFVGYAIQTLGGLPVACAVVGAVMAFGGLMSLTRPRRGVVPALARPVTSS